MGVMGKSTGKGVGRLRTQHRGLYPIFVVFRAKKSRGKDSINNSQEIQRL